MLTLARAALLIGRGSGAWLRQSARGARFIKRPVDPAPGTGRKKSSAATRTSEAMPREIDASVRGAMSRFREVRVDAPGCRAFGSTPRAEGLSTLVMRGDAIPTGGLELETLGD